MRHSRPDEPTPALDALDDALVRAGQSARPAGRWRRLLAAVVFALAVVVVSGVTSYAGASYAYQRSEVHTDSRIAVLESDLSQRRAANAAANAERDDQIAELRAVLCVTLDHLTPRDADVERLRARYQCIGRPLGR
jgi:hypothetical protein